MTDLSHLRQDFPYLNERGHHGRALVYLDNAATTQKPQQVLAGLQHFYASSTANVHRGAHQLAAQADAAYEQARKKVQAFIGASAQEEVVFVRGTTEALNLVAHSFVSPRLQPGDNFVVSIMEHHANFLPWQALCQRQGAELRIAPLNARNELDLSALRKLLDHRTRGLALVHLSNSLGTLNPVAEVVAMAHRKSIPVILDAAQSVAHLPVDVQSLGVDFLACSGHKLCGPTGVGVLYGKQKWLDDMQPYQLGGGIIRMVSEQEALFLPSPHKFEAGTPNVAGAVGLGLALDYLQGIGMAHIHAYQQELLAYATERLQAIPNLQIIGQARSKGSILSFQMGNVHPHDVSTILNEAGIAIRAGHHCTQPLMRRLGMPGTTRASFAFYNTHEEIDHLADSLQTVNNIFS